MARARFLLTEALREVLLSRRISPTRAAKNAGLYGDTLNASFRGVRCLDLDEIDSVLDAHDIPFEELLSYVNSACLPAQGPPDPVAIVASLREVPYPCFPDLRIWLTWVPTVGSGSAPAELPPLVQEIEVIRARDREEALERTRIWVSTFRNRLRGSSRGNRFRAEAVCEFAMALGMWGSIACCLGLTNDATFALEHSLRLHGRFPLSRGYARLLHWATFLALPAGKPQNGVSLAERALLTLAILGDTKALPSTMASVAAMKRYCGLEAQAAEIAGAILANPNSGPEHCFAAHQLRLHSSLLHNDLTTARLELSFAQELLPKLSSTQEISWTWWKGRVEVAAQNFEDAILVFRGLLDAAPTAMEAGDRFLIFLDLAEALQKTGDSSTLRVEARKMQKWLPLLDVAPFIRAVVLSFSQIVQQRLPEEMELQEVRSAMGKGAKGQPKAPGPTSQPQGTMMSPSSDVSLELDRVSDSSPSGSSVGPSSGSVKKDTKA